MRFVLALACLLGCGAVLAADLTLSVRPLYEGRSLAWGPMPYVATVSNRGPDATGALVAQLGDQGTVRYPVSLPRGSTKQITVIVPANALYSTNELLLDMDRGRVRRKLQVEYSYQNEANALLIGGAAGELSFLDPGAGLQVPAHAAPERPILYSTFDFVVLAETAERMSDAAVLALQTYCVGGGTIVLVGGASAPLLHDPRWTPFLPMAPTGTRNVMVARSVDQLWGRPMPAEPIAVTTGVIAAGSRVRAKGPVPLVIDRSLGDGVVLQLAFNPFDQPLRSWPGLAKLFLRHAPPRMSEIKMLGTERGGPDYHGSTTYRGSSYTSSGGYVTSSGSSFAMSSGGYPPQDAFNFELPPWGQVLTLLIIYALLAVPVNLLVLRRLRKTEWAWVTAPVLSLGFAAAFFSFAGTLYRTPLSSSAEGTLVWDTRVPQGYFMGRSQLFVPRGGRYDLGLLHADFVGNEGYSDYGMGMTSRVSLDLVDTGTLDAPNARFSNLTYHSLSLGETVATSGWLEVSADSAGKLTVRNQSPHAWQGVRLGSPGDKIQELHTLAPGESWTSEKPIDLNDAGAGPKRTNYVSGSLVGFWPGPKLGHNATRPGAIRFLAAFDPEGVRK